MSIRRVGMLLLAGSFLLSSAGVVQARDRDDKCEQRIHKAERSLENAEHKHGEHSRQAEKKREELERARARCGGHDHDHNHDHENH